MRTLRTLPSFFSVSASGAYRGSDFCHEFPILAHEVPIAAACSGVLPYDVCMERVLDKLIVFLGCCLALGFVAPPSLTVVGLLAAVIASSLLEVLPKKTRYAAAIAYLALALVVVPCALFVPLIAYDCLPHGLSKRGEHCHTPAKPDAVRGLRAMQLLCAVAFVGVAVRLSLAVCAIIAVVMAVSLLLAWRTSRLLLQHDEQRTARDELRERSLSLEARNRDLLDRQDYEVRVATLTERGRIARDIHDNVGHLLTRAVLQTQALQVTHAKDEQLQAQLAPIAATVSEALDAVRKSVHALHDDAFDLRSQLERLVEQSELENVSLRYEIDNAPNAVAYCFAAVTREALANVARHSNATRVQVRVAEYPALWNLTVTDNGSDEEGSARTTTSAGIGLRTMEERVGALGGTFRAGFDRNKHGFVVFASIPKERVSSSNERRTV